MGKQAASGQRSALGLVFQRNSATRPYYYGLERDPDRLANDSAAGLEGPLPGSEQGQHVMVLLPSKTEAILVSNRLRP
jgi:hypothetical protein